MDDTRQWLESQGFRVAENGLRYSGNLATWYAWRKSKLPARDCECNDGKGVQIVVKPHAARLHDGRYFESCEVDVTGEAGDIWFKLQAYSLSPEVLRERVAEVESSLVAAWNALRPNVELSRGTRQERNDDQ